jgi:membrane-associated phospholipid phosphatase
MRARVRAFEAWLLPKGWLDVLRQIIVFCGAYYAYRYARGAVDSRAADAFANSRDLIDIERATHTFFEPAIQEWATSAGWIIDLASWMYVNSHFTITVVALAFIYLFRNDSFYWVRNMFSIAMAVAIVGYILYPAAPPRFFPEWGFIDSVAEFTGVPATDVTVNALFNPFAAVPSMHVAFALMLGLPLARLVKPRWLKGVWLAYPVIVTFVVIVTGNHFWLDALLGALVAAVSAVGAQLMLQLHPAWAFTPRRAEAAA